MRLGSPTLSNRHPGVLAAPLPFLSSAPARWTLKALMLTLGPWVHLDAPERLAALPDPVIFALNHNNSLESLAVPSILYYYREGRPVHFLVDWMYLHVPLVGSILRQGGSIPVFTKPARWRLAERYRRSRLLTSPLDQALARLRAGASEGIFPEGTRNRDGLTLLRGRRGLGRLVLTSGAPVVPLGIEPPAQRDRRRVAALGPFACAWARSWSSRPSAGSTRRSPVCPAPWPRPGSGSSSRGWSIG